MKKLKELPVLSEGLWKRYVPLVLDVSGFVSMAGTILRGISTSSQEGETQKNRNEEYEL